MTLTREDAERAMVAFSTVAANANCRHQAEPECRRFLIACIAQFPRKTMSNTTKNKMDASKENAKKAVEELTKISDAMPEETRTQKSASLIFVQEFLAAAEKRLPTAKAIEKDKQRKKKYSGKGKKAKAAAPAPEMATAGAPTPEPVGV